VNLRRQLLLVSLLLLSLPWAGCQFIREMEGALRQGQEQALQATAGAVAAFLEREVALLYPAPARRFATADARGEIYAFPAQGPVIVDGYGDGWEDIPANSLAHTTGSPLRVDYQAQTGHDTLYLLLRISDSDVVYENPGASTEPNGDRLLLRMWHANRPTDYVIATVAPGSVRARAGSALPPDMDPARVKGYWQDAVGGYTLELELPLRYTGGRLGLFVFDARTTTGAALDTGEDATGAGNMQPGDAAPPPWFIYRPADLQQKLAPFSARGGRIQIVDHQHWLIADAAADSGDAATAAETFWLLRLLYRGILADGNLAQLPATPGSGRLRAVEIDSALAGTPAQQRYLDPRAGGRSILSAAAPIYDAQGVLGAVVVRQSGETYLSLTDQAFSRLLGLSLLALGTAAFGLLAYASLLSWRIRNLSRAVSNAVADDGRVTGTVQPSKARDEIGDLSRRYADLLARLAEHNAYLRSLSRTLSHELRTPIAVIQSSLDNLEHAQRDGAAQAVYLGRAREGLRRLQHILMAMSEASRLEESVRGQEHVALDLVPLLREVFAAYRSLYPAQQLSLEMEADSAQVTGVAELIVQALDKLMDNAAAFCPPQGYIQLRLYARAGYWCLELANDGPPLPEDAAREVFEPMVSLRKGSDEAVHLGLGLHMVRLIVEAHGGHVHARNLPEKRGVAVTIELPMAT
tara:strand:- start:2606 stop:4684 length:2079 start_codon:yes stop_codon:yes gene_type:complete